MAEKKDNASLSQPTAEDITAGADEVTSDALSKLEQTVTEVENRSQRLGSDSVELKTRLQKEIFSIVVVVIVVFYFVFIITAAKLLGSGLPFTKEFAVTGVVLVGMVGSIPTILSLFLMNGLFGNKEASKDKDDRSSIPDISVTAKIITEVMKLTSKPH